MVTSFLIIKSHICVSVQVDHKDSTHEKLLAFNRLWMTRFDADSLLIYSTGRSPELFGELAVRNNVIKLLLLVQTALFCSNLCHFKVV